MKKEVSQRLLSLRQRAKRSQMQLSFGMIFSIVLIIFFVAFAFYAINKFLSLQNTLKAGKFVSELQEDIDNMWRGFQGSQEVEYILPSKVEKICFADFSSGAKGEDSVIYSELKQVFYGEENLFFYPTDSSEGLDSKQISHIDIEKITENENPFCITSSKSKVKLTIAMQYGESSVTIKK